MGVVSDAGAKPGGRPPGGPADDDAAAALEGAPAVPATERLLNRLVSPEDGGYYTLVKLCGSGVPPDLELYFCKNTFTVVQVRIKTSVGGVVHEYAVRAEDIGAKGGVYELKCQRSAHELQVKVQPPLGLLGLIRPPPYSTAAEVDAMLRKLYAVTGLFHVLAAFQRDPTREEVPLAATARGATRHVGRLTGDEEVLRLFFEKCSVFSRVGDGQAQVMRLADCARPRSRGMLLKALLEVKMLLVIAVEHFQSDEGQFTGLQLQDFHNFLIEIHEDCCAGGAGAQYKHPGESWQSLKALVCGPGEEAPKAVEEAPLRPADARKVLQECVANLKNSVLPRLQQKGEATELQPPSTDFSSAAGGAEFKRCYNRIWQRAIDVYLFDLVHSGQYPKGTAGGMALIRSQWTRPDRALQLLCPSVDLDKAIQEFNAELEPFLADKAAKRLNGVGKDGINFNPRNSTGLVNPGENLCAANALLQLLFSTEPFRAAVLEAPEPAAPDAGDAAKPPSSALEGEVRQLVAGTRRVFTEMSHPDRASTCAREVAAALYGKELGQQQDCDELMHKLSLLLQEGLSAIPEKPYEALQEAFKRLFVGATYEMRLRNESLNAKVPDGVSGGLAFQPVCPEGGDASHKQFLSIPVQQGNRTLTQALEDFTAWSSTGGTEVAWTQERFRTVPPFLCFASRQVSSLEWEESLNLTPFVISASPSMQQSRYERCKAVQLQVDLQDALQHIAPASNSLVKANLLSSQSLAAEVDHLAKVSDRLHSRLAPISDRINELDAGIGDGFDEPPLEDFLSGAVDPAVIRDVIRGLLGADSVRKLANLVLDGESSGNDTLQQLVQEGTLADRDSEALLGRLRARWQEQHAHMYDLHAIVVYQGMGQFGHYIAFIRQPDGLFLCFDDEQVRDHADASAVRSEIAERGSDGFPASVRMVVYRRRGPGAGEPLELPGPGPAAQAAPVANGVVAHGARHTLRAAPPGTGAGEPGAAEEVGDAKRRRAQ